MIIGIPRAFLYHRYSTLWKTFFEELGIEYVISPATTREIMSQGMACAIDEACLSSKVYIGHVEWLIDRCDKILVPRISYYGPHGTVCTKFQAIYDVVRNTFRSRSAEFLDYNIDTQTPEGEPKAFLKLGKSLGRRTSSSMRAYLVARQALKADELMEQRLQEKQLDEPGIKVLVVSHRYNIYDKFIGEPILQDLRRMGVVPVLADAVNRQEAVNAAAEISGTLPWAFNKELVGAMALWKERVDGIMLVSTFPCGPDSLVNEIVVRRIDDIPILNLVIDGQEGSAGLETRLESFIDVIKFKRDDYSAEV